MAPIVRAKAQAIGSIFLKEATIQVILRQMMDLPANLYSIVRRRRRAQSILAIAEPPEPIDGVPFTPDGHVS